MYTGLIQANTGWYSTWVRLGNKEHGFVEKFRYLGHSWLQTAEMISILKNNSGGKMKLAICWWWCFHLYLLRQKSNCPSHIVTRFMDVLFGVIHTRTLLENLLTVIVTHSRALLTSPDTPARVWHLRWTQLVKSMWCSANLLTSWSAEYSFPNSFVTTIVNSDAYHQSPLVDKW